MGTVLFVLAVAVVSAVGALARFSVHEWFRVRHATTFPYGTLAVNLSGSLALGWIYGRGIGGDAAFLLGTGALGSYTTFSTWMFESERLVDAHETRIAAANVGVSLVAGLVAVACGWALGAL
jgi:CrcB protein